MKPTTQLTSRGLRNAPVKNTRIMCVTIAAMKIRAAQWWICRMSRPPRTSNDSRSVEANASDICDAVHGGPRARRSATSFMLGTKNIVRKTPEIRIVMKLNSAISPSRNDQWSGKILRANVLTDGADAGALVQVVRGARGELLDGGRGGCGRHRVRRSQ